MAEQGILYGVGVGPGDPRLMTIRAGGVIRNADVIAYPVNGGGNSQARAIAAPIIRAGTAELPVHIPMKVEREPARRAYDESAALISEHLKEGCSVAWLCVGDPLFYGSFMYLATRLGGSYKIEVIPGVTSLSACAAQMNTPLAGRDDVLSVVPATLDEGALKAALEHADTAVVIKVGRHFAKVRDVLRGLGLAGCATILEGATGENERIRSVEEVTDAETPYFSTILVRERELE